MAHNLFIPYYARHRAKVNTTLTKEINTVGFLCENTHEHIILCQHFAFDEGSTRPSVNGTLRIAKADIVEFYPLKSAVSTVRMGESAVEDAVVVDAGVAPITDGSL